LRARNKQLPTLSLDYEYKNSDGDTLSLGDKLTSESDVDFVDIDFVYKKLTPREQEVFELKKSGLSTEEIANILDIKTRTVTRDLRKVKILLREQMNQGRCDI
jgi:RNA polymerase sigma factor (sigma-70 family)